MSDNALALILMLEVGFEPTISGDITRYIPPHPFFAAKLTC